MGRKWGVCTQWGMGLSNLTCVNHGRSGVATGYRGEKSPHFCQYGARNYFKIDEKITGGGRGVANLQRSRGRGQKCFIYAAPPFKSWPRL